MSFFQAVTSFLFGTVAKLSVVAFIPSHHMGAKKPNSRWLFRVQNNFVCPQAASIFGPLRHISFYSETNVYDVVGCVAHLGAQPWQQMYPPLPLRWAKQWTGPLPFDCIQTNSCPHLQAHIATHMGHIEASNTAHPNGQFFTCCDTKHHMALPSNGNGMRT